MRRSSTTSAAWESRRTSGSGLVRCHRGSGTAFDLHGTFTGRSSADRPAWRRSPSSRRRPTSGSTAAGIRARPRRARCRPRRGLQAADVVAALGEARASPSARRGVDRAHRRGGGDPGAPRRAGERGGAGVARRAAAGRRARHACAAGLSEREVEVLRELASGRTNKEIARRLGRHRRPWATRCRRSIARPAVPTRAGATLFAIEHGLAVDGDRAGA